MAAGKPTRERPSRDRLTEDQLIATLFAPIAGRGGLDLADDAACLTPPAGTDLVVTADALVAGVHFFADDAPASIARKALRVNLSDLAAKGAAPLGFLLTLALPPQWTVDWLQAFAAALGEDAAAYRCPLLGGDTVRMPGPLTLSITAFGTVPAGSMVRRAGARPGDIVAVTGTIGDAALGLRMRLAPDETWIAALSGRQRRHLAERYLHPAPRLELASALREHASAAMDVSDGLVGDLTKLLAVSGVTAAVDLEAVPLSAAARAACAAQAELAETAFTGGDDYEIVCSVAPQHLAALGKAAAAAGIGLTRIATIEAGRAPPIFRDAHGQRQFVRVSYAHY
jgi:thiamine-monophosphate kinase